jgi:hypothetical protein
MVAPQDGDAIFKAHFQRYQEGHGLDRVVPTVDVVSHQQVVCVWALATNPEELNKVLVLPVYIAAHCHRALDGLHIRFLD